jgi:transposase
LNAVTSLTDIVEVVIGVDTHVHTHAAAAVDACTGGVLGEITVPATAQGYADLVEFAEEHSGLRLWAIEGTGSHGAGLTRHLTGQEEVVVELDRPARAKRRHGAKSDPLDAIRAAREALARPRLGTPRSTGDRQALAVLLAVRRSAVDTATLAQRQLFSLVIAAPEQLRTRFAGQKMHAMLRTAAALRVNHHWDTETTTTATMLRTLARRSLTAIAEAADHERALRALVNAWRPDLLTHPGVGPIVAATVLCAWSHTGRIHSEAGFAMLAGVAPIPANSGQTTTHYRLNPYGDRHPNAALHTVVITRLRCHEPTRTYKARRTQEGKTAREIRRCLKRYVARELYRLLENPTTTLDAT